MTELYWKKRHEGSNVDAFGEHDGDDDGDDILDETLTEAVNVAGTAIDHTQIMKILPNVEESTEGGVGTPTTEIVLVSDKTTARVFEGIHSKSIQNFFFKKSCLCIDREREKRRENVKQNLLIKSSKNSFTNQRGTHRVSQYRRRRRRHTFQLIII